MTFFQTVMAHEEGLKNLVGKGLWLEGEGGGLAIFWRIGKDSPRHSYNGKTILISFSLLQYIKVTFTVLYVTVVHGVT